MKAVRVRAPAGLENLELVDLPDPGQPGPGHVRVRIHASSLNFHDLGVVSGRLKTQNGRIPMADGAGVVEAVGASVTAFAPGDHVVSCFFPDWEDGPPPFFDFATTPGDGVDGFAQEIVVAPAQEFTRAPRGYSHAEAATLTTAGLTAWRALVVEGNLKAGDTVLTLGTGGVSIFALQIAKAMGAQVISTSSSNDKLERLRTLGADQTINYREQPNWGQAVRDVTGGRGADHVLEVVGPATLAQSALAVRGGGIISLIGALQGIAGEFPMFSLLLKQVRLQGILVGSRRQQQDMIRAIDQIGLRPVIDRSFKLSELADAFRHEISGAHFGKICVEF